MRRARRLRQLAWPKRLCAMMSATLGDGLPAPRCAGDFASVSAAGVGPEMRYQPAVASE